MPGGAQRAKALTLVLAAAIGCLAPAAVAQKETSHASLQWVRLPGSEACIGPQELARAVEARIGRAVFASAARAELAVEGHVAPSEEGFEATLSVSRADGSIVGTRHLGPVATCRELDEPLAVVIALLLDPDGPDPPPEQDPAPAAPTPASAPWQASAHGGVAVLVGPLPAPALAFELGLALGNVPSWELEATYMAAPWARGDRDELDGRFWLHAGSLALCRDFAGGERARMGGCVVGLAGMMWGEAEGRESPAQGFSTARAPLVTVGLRARGVWRLVGPLWVELSGDVAAHLVRPRFVYTALDESTLALTRRELWRALPVGLRGACRLRVVF